MDNQQAQVDPPTNPENYAAALELAYPLAIEAYKEAERRMDVIEKRLQDVLAFAVTITLGMIGLLAGKIELRTPFFYVAMLLCLLGLSIGLYARLSGGLALISLTKIYDHYLIFTASKFKLAAVENAGEDSAINAQTIRNKANLTAFAAFIFLAEGACLVATVVNQPISAPHATAVQRPLFGGSGSAGKEGKDEGVDGTTGTLAGFSSDISILQTTERPVLLLHE